MRLAALALSLSACSTYGSVQAGPAAVMGEGGRGGGAVIDGAYGQGSSGQGDPTFLAIGARVLLTEEHQQVAGLAGVSRISPVGEHHLVTFGANFGEGVEHVDDNVFFDVLLQARVGLGFVLSSEAHEENHAGANWLFGPASLHVRDQRVLTVTLAGDANLRFGPEPFYSVSLMVGFMSLREAHEPPPYRP